MRGAIEDFQSVGGIGNFLGILFPKRLILFFEVLSKNRCRAGGDVKWAERATKRLECRYDLNILSIPSSLKVAERDDFDQIEERHGFVASQVVQFLIEVSPDGRKLRAESLLLVIASGVEIGAISGT